MPEHADARPTEEPLRVSPEMAAVAAVLVAAGAVAAWYLAGPATAAAVCAAGVFLAIAAVDACELRIPDALSLTLGAGGIALSAAGVWPVALADAAIGAAALYVLGAGAGRMTGSRATLGRGDWKLLAATGAWLGLSAGAIGVAVAMLIAAVLLWTAARADRTTPVSVPFGTILGPVSAVAVVWMGLLALGS
jgi:prepilin signal peptidase PulO-like enzyme (type II secretory pathway)